MAGKAWSITILVLWLAVFLAAQQGAPPRTLQDKNNQTLEAPRDPPPISAGETGKLLFHVSPLSERGLLSQQTRDAVKAILKLNGGAPIVHIRAFSAGNGDIRRVPQIVSDVLGDKHGPLPSISLVQIGSLPLSDAQIVLETVSLGRKDVNKTGLTFHPEETVIASDPGAPVKPLLQGAVDRLAAKMNGAPALSVTCYVSALDDASGMLQAIGARFSGAAVNLVQPRRVAWRTEAGCEGVSRGGNPSVARFAFSGTQVAFGITDKDASLAMHRLERAFTDAGVPRIDDAALLRFYLLSPGTSGIALKEAPGPAPVESLLVEGVGSMSAGFAMDAIVPVR